MAKKKIDETAALKAAEVITPQTKEKVDDMSLDGLLTSMDGETILEETSTQETDVVPPAPPKRTRKKKEPAPSDDVQEELDENKPPDGQHISAPVTQPTRRSRRTPSDSILTIESGTEIESPEQRADAAWHEIHNAYRTRRILTGRLGGVEQTDAGKTVVVVSYNDFRVLIPLKEMMINIASDRDIDYNTLIMRQNQILSNMMGAEIDFVVKGIDSKSRSVVASRREAMMKKRQTFYMNTDAASMYRIYENRIVQARVIAVADKVIRVEVFGVECSIMARDLAWDWIGDAHDRFSVGDETLVRIREVTRGSLEEISVKADVKSVTDNTNSENLKRVRVQSKYIGTVTGIFKGVVYIRLSNGVNAVAHSCMDRRMPGKKDDVSFAVTHIDEERSVAVGIITRIIKQNL